MKGCHKPLFCKKNSVSVKYNKLKGNKTRYRKFKCIIYLLQITYEKIEDQMEI